MALIDLGNIEINHRNKLEGKDKSKQKNPMELFDLEYNQGNFDVAYKICKEHKEIIPKLGREKTIKMLETSFEINKDLDKKLAVWKYTH